MPRERGSMSPRGQARLKYCRSVGGPAPPTCCVACGPLPSAVSALSTVLTAVLTALAVLLPISPSSFFISGACFAPLHRCAGAGTERRAVLRPANCCCAHV